jgi:uncharacterized Tic20 family protein
MTQGDIPPTGPSESDATTPPSGAAPPPPVGSPTIGYSPAAYPEYVGPPPSADDQNMGMLCHLLGIFTSFLAPLIIWLIKKDTSPWIDHQGKEALNFQITALIATVQASKGIPDRYPISLRLIK